MTEEIKQRIEIIKTGKVPTGYKKTVVGIFPNDWITEQTLGDMFRFYGGLGVSREQLGNKGIAYLHYGDMHGETFKKVSYEQYSLLPKYDIQLDGNEKFLMKDGDIAFLDASEDLEGTSRSVLVDNPDNKFFIAGLHTTLGKPKNDFLDKWYKQYITTTDIVKKQFQKLAVGFKVYGVNRKEITKIIIPCPSKKDEQNRIAEILSKWDKAVELQEKLIEKLELQKKGLMQKLLTSKNKWEKVKLNKVLKERKVYSIKGLEYPHVTLSKQGIIDKTEQYNRDFLVASNKKGYKITHYNDLCYNPANLKFGVICLNKYGKAIFSPIYVTFEIQKEYNCDFIGAVLSRDDFVRRIRRFEEGSLYERQAVKSNDFVKDSILVPDKDLQDKIGNIILLIENNVTLQTQKLEKLKQQRKSIQQLLLTGIVRV